VGACECKLQVWEDRMATSPRYCENSFHLWAHGHETDMSTAPQIWYLTTHDRLGIYINNLHQIVIPDQIYYFVKSRGCLVNAKSVHLCELADCLLKVWDLTV